MKFESVQIGDFYVSTLTPNRCIGYLLYVHGGPGAHCAYFEAGVQELSAYRAGPFGWIAYDQRGCGRSQAAAETPTHEQNIADLAQLVRHFQTKVPLLGIVGHSYGGWLSFHTLEENKDLSIPLIVVASAKDIRTAKNHSFALDMLELRLDQPETYRKLLPELADWDQPLWEFQKRIRALAAPLKRRPLFMWGNLDTLAWYEKLKARVGMPENWDFTHRISSAVKPEHLLKEIDPNRLPSGLLWIMGAHDLLMMPDQYFPDEKSPTTTFSQSGHYPHFEEPKRFIRELESFIEKA